MPTNWRRIEELFHQASDLHAGERIGFLVAECKGDDALRWEVESLLSAGDGGKELPGPFVPKGLRPGQLFDRFEVLATCGQGSGGTVYSARDTRTGQQVALKVFPPSLTAEQQRRYIKEVQAISALHHPHIIGIREAGRSQDRDYLVMEYVDGCTLGEIIPAGGMPVEQALDLARMMAEGLAAAHAAGIVHRDLKPSNVMRTRGGSIKLVDFGLAKRVDLVGESPLLATMNTATGQMVGTACYLSPEQAKGEAVDARTDIFSFGAVLYEMLTGVRPFDRGSMAATLAAILRDTPKPIREMRSGVPPDVWRLVRRCLQKDGGKRFASAQELLKVLVHCRARLTGRTRRIFGVLRRPPIAASIVACFASVAITVLWLSIHASRVRNARDSVEPEITRLVGRRQYNAADVLARQIEAIVPADQIVRDFARDYRVVTSVTASAPGAEVSIKDYTAPEQPWRAIGRSPLKNVTIPLGYLRWRVSAPGYRTREFSETGVLQPSIHFAIYLNHTEPPDMETVPEGTTRNPGAVKVPQFSMDRFEVTNRGYQEFVSASGYLRRELWQQPFIVAGRHIAWEQAMAMFRDRTGRSGPAGWELGHYRDGDGDLPVTGVSWYEAEAYARFVGKRLPVYSEWLRAARTEWLYADEILISNFSGKALAPVGSYHGLGRFGTYDLVGNCKEWLSNEWGSGQRVTMGGAWDEAYYAARVSDSAPAAERRANIGFRCARSATPPASSALDPVEVVTVRDYSREQPVGDREFARIRQVYDYARTPLNAKLEKTDNSNLFWRMEKVSFDAAYPGERVTAYLFLPRGATAPYQTVVYAPSGIAYSERSSEHLEMWFIEPLIRSGRAVLYPVQWEMYERKPKVAIPAPNRNFIRTTRSVQDLRRSIDYLETRPDIAAGKLAYFGFSAGAFLSPLVLATEPRLRVAELAVAGLDQALLPGEIDPFQFVRHVHQPSLVMEGRYDLATPGETSQQAFFSLLGTAPKDKKLVFVEAGHAMVGFPATTRESLEWLERYLGTVPMPVLNH